MNCWEFQDCGRELGGKKAKEMGVCPVAVEISVDGINNGKNGGRSCWAVAGTLCGGQQQGTYSEKLGNCLQCDFYAFVRGQQRQKFVNTRKILDVIAGKITASCVIDEEKPDSAAKKAM
jgi:hypothetical protein